MRFSSTTPPMGTHRILALLLFLILTDTPLAIPAAAQEQEPAEEATIVGRIFDVQTREPVEGMSVTIPGTSHDGVTDGTGLFRLQGVAPGPAVVLRFEHLAYGVQSDTLSVVAGERKMLQISLAREAIDIDPLVVTVMSEADRRERAAGTSLEIITEEEIARLVPRYRGIEGVLKSEVPGIRISDRSGLIPGIPGVYICVEFRGVAKSLRDNPPCRYPLVILDQVRIDDPVKIEALVSTLELEDVHQIEMISPAAAGVQYGTGSQNGVLVIETKLKAPAAGVGPSALPADPGSPGDHYNWALEPAGHPTWRTLGATAVGNAAGLALGLWTADQCVDFDRLHMDLFNSTCGGAAGAGTRLAALALPVLGSTLAARFAGRTDLSQGSWRETAAFSLIMLVPGYVLAGTGFGEKGSRSVYVGKAMLAFGVPIVTTLADRIYRQIRAPGER